nr:hypothetical protein OG781_03165 [Streptomyces sp. NBC_00830]
MSEDLAEVVAGGQQSPLAAGAVLAAQEELAAVVAGHDLSDSATTLIISAAARYDVLVQADRAGTTQLETQPFDTGPAGNTFPQVNLATVVTGGPAMVPARIPSLIGPLVELTHAKIADHKTMVYTEKDNFDTP